MNKKILLFATMLALAFSNCRDRQKAGDTGRKVKEYTIGQFYQSSNLSGGKIGVMDHT